MGPEENGAMLTRTNVRMQNPSMGCLLPPPRANHPVFAMDTMILWVKVNHVGTFAILMKMLIALTVHHTIIEWYQNMYAMRLLKQQNQQFHQPKSQKVNTTRASFYEGY